MALGTMEWFKIIIIIMLFYSGSITLLTYALPANTLSDYAVSYGDLAEDISLNSISGTVQDSITSQTNIPVIDIGALVFYSGNILIDLLLNFAFAIPEMIGLFITGILLLINIDTQLANTVQLFSTVIITVLWFISIIQLLLSVRSGQGVV